MEISQQWLATGKGATTPYVILNKEISDKVTLTNLSLFSEVYDKLLAQHCKRVFDKIHSIVAKGKADRRAKEFQRVSSGLPTKSLRDAIRSRLTMTAANWSDSIPDAALQSFADELDQEVKRIISKYQAK